MKCPVVVPPSKNLDTAAQVADWYLIESHPALTPASIWVSDDVRTSLQDEKWLNALVRRFQTREYLRHSCVFPVRHGKRGIYSWLVLAETLRTLQGEFPRAHQTAGSSVSSIAQSPVSSTSCIPAVVSCRLPSTTCAKSSVLVPLSLTAEGTPGGRSRTLAIMLLRALGVCR